jgi:UDPglucose--hexose-1-phosphate uridylyltransferase
MIHPASPELRFDALTREWVAIVDQRQTRPNLPSKGRCPFCVGGLEAPEPYEVRAFPNRWPALVPGDRLREASTNLERTPARGAAEIVLYTSDHNASMASLGRKGTRRVIDLWAERTEALLSRPEVAYVLVFENRGREVGATIDHPHGQIYAFGFVPPVPAKELATTAEHGCPVCDLVRAERDHTERVVFDNGSWVGWVPSASAWPYGLLIAPSSHVDGLPGLLAADRDGFATALGDVLSRYDRLFAREFPYMLWIHQQPADPRAHLHVHVAPPLRSTNAMRFIAAGELGSGVMFNPVLPEAAAAALRDS